MTKKAPATAPFSIPGTEGKRSRDGCNPNEKVPEMTKNDRDRGLVPLIDETQDGAGGELDREGVQARSDLRARSGLDPDRLTADRTMHDAMEALPTGGAFVDSGSGREARPDGRNPN